MKINKDIVIIGAGPAGMSAAIYLARTSKTFVIIEKAMSGGKLNVTTDIENYPGLGKTDGTSIGLSMKKQLKELGVEITKDTANDVVITKEGYELVCENNTYVAKVLIIATGSSNKKFNLPNEEELVGKGISYCAVCDGFFYRKKDVLVFANSRKGYLEALYLTNLANKVYLVSDKDEDDLEGNLKELKAKQNVEFMSPYNITKFIGEDHLTQVEIENLNTNEKEIMDIDGCFPFKGDVPSNYLAKKLNLDLVNGYILVDKFMATNIKGVYAIGDIIDKPLRQVVTACNDGAIAATSSIRYLNSLKK